VFNTDNALVARIVHAFDVWKLMNTKEYEYSLPIVRERIGQHARAHKGFTIASEDRLFRNPGRASDQFAATIGAGAFQNLVGTASAKCAFKGTDHRVFSVLGKLSSHFSQLLFISNIAPCLRYFRTFIAKPSTIESYLLLLVTFGGVKFSEIIAIR
jgi:hypothetical protein